MWEKFVGGWPVTCAGLDCLIKGALARAAIARQLQQARGGLMMTTPV